MHKCKKCTALPVKKHYFRSEDIFKPVNCKKEDTVNSFQLKYLQKLVGKDWNVKMHLSPSREAIHGRRACPVHRGHAQYTGRQAQYTASMRSTQAGMPSPVHRQACPAQYTGRHAQCTAGMPSTQAGMPSTQAGMPSTQRACPVHSGHAQYTGRQYKKAALQKTAIFERPKKCTGRQQC